MASFDSAFARLKVLEGKYVCGKNDRGGETYIGISRKFWPNWAGWKHVDLAKDHEGAQPKRGTKEYLEWVKQLDYTLGQDYDLQGLVTSFYHVNFWREEYEQIDSDEIAGWIFQMAVNTGHRGLVHRWVQLAVGAVTDGVLGPKSLAAINAVPNQMDLLNIVRGKSEAYYREIVAHDPSQSKFLNGWLAR